MTAAARSVYASLVAIRGCGGQRDERARGAMATVERHGVRHLVRRRRHVVAASAVHVLVDEPG